MSKLGWSMEVEGLEPVQKMFLRLSDFQHITRPVVQAAVDAAEPYISGALPAGKARSSVGKRVVRYRDGIVGVVGPRGGSHRPGFLAALFLERGTGVHGHRRARIVARNLRGHKRILWFPSQATVNARFGAQSSIFLKSGRLSALAQRRYGNAGFVAATSSAGMPARPWFQRARTAAEGPIQRATVEALRAVIHG